MCEIWPTDGNIPVNCCGENNFFWNEISEGEDSHVVSLVCPIHAECEAAGDIIWRQTPGAALPFLLAWR